MLEATSIGATLRSILAGLPILVLLVALLGFRLPARKAGALSFIVAALVSVTLFRIDMEGLSIAIGKGFSLALYVLLIIWAAVLLYNLVDRAGAIKVISENIILVIEDRFVQFLLLSWVFSSFLQGIAGFGVPVAIVTPILVQLGFNPVASVAAVLIGHCWSISFGSMGSSFYTIGLVTGLPSEGIAFWMALYTAIAMFLTGLGVCFIKGGLPTLRRGLVYVVPTSIVMTGSLFLVTYLQMTSVVSLLTALVGIVFMYSLYRVLSRAEMPERLYSDGLTLGQAILPYALIIALSVLFQVLPIQAPELAFDFPGFETDLGYFVAPEQGYAAVNFLSHPAPIILMSGIVGGYVFVRRRTLSVGGIGRVFTATVDKCIGTTLALVFLICTALVMMDSGMVDDLAHSVAHMSGHLYPVFAPFVGVLGSFITSSNTNSNVIFGSFQAAVATTLSVNPVIMAGVQSIGGSVGASLGPTQVLLGTSSVGLTGQESVVYRRIIYIVLLTALVLGVVNLFVLGA